MYQAELSAIHTPDAPPGEHKDAASIKKGSPISREHHLALEVQAAMTNLFQAASVRPDAWEEALASLAPKRPTQARRAFRHFMSWDDTQRQQALAALEGAIVWAREGRTDLLAKITNEYPLSPRMAHELVACWPASDRDAIDKPYNQWRNAVNELVTRYQRLAFKLAGQFQARFGETEDWASTALVALIKAAELYDPEKAEFMTFAYNWIQAELRKSYEVQSERYTLTPSSLDTQNESKIQAIEETFGQLVPGPNLQFVSINRSKEVANAIQVLTERERIVIQRLFGLNGLDEAETAEELSRDMGITRARVYQIKSGALSKMKDSIAA